MGYVLRMANHTLLDFPTATLSETFFWTAVPPDEDAAPALEASESMLSEEERARAHRFHFFADRSAYITAHALLRRALSEIYEEISPGAWNFENTPIGKPFLPLEAGFPRLHFSLTHSRRLVACLVSRDGVCGIDVEQIGRVSDPLFLSRSRFSEVETGDLAALSGRRRDAYFTELWCLKEAYLKAKGVGLTVPLSDVYFRFEPGEATPSTFCPLAGDAAADWCFRLMRPNDTHVLAAAVCLRGA